jgi:hypothetical protein
MRGLWKTCLILLLVALLPARGWAVAAMTVAPAAPAHGGASLLMPCHAEAEIEAEANHAGPATDAHAHAHAPATTPDLTHACASCDLCHTQLAASSCKLQTAALPRANAPAVLPARDTGRLLAASLERPPRA